MPKKVGNDSPIPEQPQQSGSRIQSGKDAQGRVIKHPPGIPTDKPTHLVHQTLHPTDSAQSKPNPPVQNSDLIAQANNLVQKAQQLKKQGKDAEAETYLRQAKELLG